MNKKKKKVAVSMLDITSDGLTLCYSCNKHIDDGQPSKQLQKGLKVYLGCIQCWLINRSRILKGQI